MSDSDDAAAERRRPSIFLSYASEDREAARRLRDALAVHGLEGWYDESELGGGEEWDRKIRRQIRECDYFMPVVSARTEARREGYFRREWRLAVERTLDMADDHPFLLPVVIDDTSQAAARVPEKFLTVQWLKVPGGAATSAFEAMLDRIAQGTLGQAPPPRRPSERIDVGSAASTAGGAARRYPPFPEEQPGQRLRFLAMTLAWAWRSLWIWFRGLRWWLRWFAIIWIAIALISRCDSSSERSENRPGNRAATNVSAAKMAKLRAISDKYQATGANKSDVDDLAAEIAKEFSGSEDASGAVALLAMAFTAPGGDAEAEKLANSAFAMTYGMVSLSHKGQVGLIKEPTVSKDTALARGRTAHAAYVLYGTVGKAEGHEVIDIKIAQVADGGIVWSKSYDALGADPAKIAADVDANVPSLESR